ncbi:hypothetical protein AB9P05_16335 [Roseivirga sp. BDSF3-8]|uniref:hypothetical protein n=1 Tax=Roseivirga sp. BDSF3-8 TaxID=3241598 RepID=UPI003531EF7D
MRTLLTILLMIGGLTALAGPRATPADCTGAAVAGSYIPLSYCLEDMPQGDSLQLMIEHAFGLQILHSVPVENRAVFMLPLSLSRKAGVLSVQLLSRGQSLHHRTLRILPDTSHRGALEAYAGPKHLITDHEDHTMVVVSLLDSMDNPYPPGALVNYLLMAKGEVQSGERPTGVLHSYMRMKAPVKAGYGSITIRADTVSHTTFRVNFYANDPEDFRIMAEREHGYADDKQLISLTTDMLQDRHGNVVGNGTIVHFLITNSEGARTMAVGRATEGRAEVKMPAPAYPTTWQIRAEVPYYATSSEDLTLDFKASLTGYPLHYTPVTRRLTIGPVRGFTGHYLADATPVKVRVLTQDDTVRLDTELRDGLATIQIPAEISSWRAEAEIATVIETFNPQAKNER